MLQLCHCVCLSPVTHPAPSLRAPAPAHLTPSPTAPGTQVRGMPHSTCTASVSSVLSVQSAALLLRCAGRESEHTNPWGESSPDDYRYGNQGFADPREREREQHDMNKRFFVVPTLSFFPWSLHPHIIALSFNFLIPYSPFLFLLLLLYITVNESATIISCRVVGRLLDPANMLQFDDFKKCYGEILYRWGLREKRAEVLKFASCPPEPHRGIGRCIISFQKEVTSFGSLVFENTMTSEGNLLSMHCMIRNSALPPVLWSSLRIRCVLLPLPQPGPGHAVCHLPTPHLPVCHLPRGRAWGLQLLPELRPRRPHQPHDGLVQTAGRVSGWLRLPLPAAEHLLNSGGFTLHVPPPL